jgi:hypothetical protein
LGDDRKKSIGRNSAILDKELIKKTTDRRKTVKLLNIPCANIPLMVGELIGDKMTKTQFVLI